jgi:hypothetical protein
MGFDSPHCKSTAFAAPISMKLVNERSTALCAGFLYQIAPKSGNAARKYKYNTNCFTFLINAWSA